MHSALFRQKPSNYLLTFFQLYRSAIMLKSSIDFKMIVNTSIFRQNGYLCATKLLHMKTFLLFLYGSALCLFPTALMSQISITSSMLPGANDTLITQSATLLTAVDLDLTGTSYYWDFGPEVLTILPNSTTLPCYDVDDTPLAYQFLFNNPFLYPAHNSDYGNGVEAFSLATISFEDAYMYYKNSGNQFSITGMGASINGIPLAAQKIDPELLFNTPLDFMDSDASYSEMEFSIPGFGFYGQTVDRSYLCDGWGTMSIAGAEYEVLRIRSEVSGTDSIYSETFNFGLQLPRPATVEYTWYAAEFKVPLLQIIVTEGTVSSVTTAPLALSSAMNEVTTGRALFPNPANAYIYLGVGHPATTVYDGMGKVIGQYAQGAAPRVDTGNWPAGVYHVVQGNEGLTHTLLVIH